MTAEPEFYEHCTEAEWLGAEPEIPEEYTVPGWVGLKPEYGDILKFAESAEIYQDIAEVPVGTLLEDADGSYVVRLATGEFLFVTEDFATFYAEPQKNAPYIRVDMDAYHEDRRREDEQRPALAEWLSNLNFPQYSGVGPHGPAVETSKVEDED